MMLRNLCRWLLVAWLLTACNDPEDALPRLPPGPDSTGGVIVLNEGGFTYQNASVSLYHPADGSVRTEVFRGTNGFPLGDVLHSAAFAGARGYLVINNSRKIEAIDATTLASVGVIEGVNSPRYLLPVGEGKGYVSELYADRLYVVDLDALAVTDSLSVSGATEWMVRIGFRAYVANYRTTLDDRPGGNNLLAIDATRDEIVDSLNLPGPPTGLVRDADNLLWVLFGGAAPRLLRVDPTTLAVVQDFTFEGFENAAPRRLTTNARADTLYFASSDGLFRHPIGRAALSPTPFVPQAGNWYGLGVDPANGEVYAADALDFAQRGLVYRYRADGHPLDTFRVGVIPNGFVFR